MSSNIIHLNNQNFSEEVENYNGVVLVDFFADWCAPCKMLAPVIQEIAEEYKGKAKICKLDTDEAQEIAIKYQINGIPAILIFQNGQVKDNLVGFRPKNAITEILDKYI